MFVIAVKKVNKMNNSENGSIRNDTPEIELSKSTTSILMLLHRLSECDLSKTDIKVLELVLFSASRKIDPMYENFEINKTWIGHVLNMKRPNVSRTIKKLVEVNLLKKYSDDTYRVYYF